MLHFWHIRKNSGQIFDLDGFSLYSRLMGHEPAHPVTKLGELFSLVGGSDWLKSHETRF